MKKLFVTLALLVVLISVVTPTARAIEVTIKVGLGVARYGDCQPGKGICFIVIISKTLTNGGLARSEAGTDIELIDGTAELKDGKLIITAKQPLSENARSKQGRFDIAIKEQGVKSTTIIDPAVAKQLGAEGLVVLPGNYEFNGNTLALKVSNPRDVSTGQSSGKRNNIAIDEQGVQKAPKATYDLKENKK